MRRVLTELVQEARAAGVPISVAEGIDAIRAAAAIDLEREELREALAAALVKDEGDRPIFDEVFDRFFSTAGAEDRKKRKKVGGAGEGGRGRLADGAGAGRGREPSPEQPTSGLPMPSARALARRPRPQTLRRLRRRELLAKPFRELDPLEGEELAALAHELARRFRGRLRRRLRRGRRGRLDFRRTLRHSIARGGTPIDLEFRRRRPGRIDVVALCDVSGSVRFASELFAAVLLPCRDLLRSLRVFVFVDQPVEASFEENRLVPHGAVDFHAFSDLGRVLAALDRDLAPAMGRNTLFLVLGDARNNRRPPRADLLAKIRSRVRAVWWLVPEARGRWGQGDSAIEAYRRHCDQLLECANGAQLLAALARVSGGRRHLAGDGGIRMRTGVESVNPRSPSR